MDMHMPAGRIDPEPAPGLEDSVRAEQLALLTTNRADQYINILTAGIVVAIVRDLYPAWLLALWLFLCIAVVLARSLVVARYKTRPESHRRFAQLIIAGTIAIGVLWGLAATAILLTDNPDIQFFLMIMLGGMMAGGVMGNAASLPAMYGFALPIILPSVFAFATRGTDMHLLGLLQALYSGIVLNAGRKFNHVITDNIRLRLGESGLLEKLRTSESAMTISQKLAHIGTWEYDAKTGSSYFSPEAYNIFGVRPGTFQPSFEGAFARVHPDDRPIVTRHIKMHRTAATSPGLEVRLLMDDGTIKYVQEIRRTIFDANGRATRIIGSVQDVSLRRAADQKLQFANLLLQTQMEASPDGVQVVDAARHIVAFNHRFAAMWRIKLAELERGDDALILARIAAQVKNPEAYAARAEYLFSHPESAGDDEIETLDGRIIERHSVALQPVAGGPALGRVRFFRDITARRTAQKTQEFDNLLLRTQMEASPDGILVVGLNRNMTTFNTRFAEIWGIPLEEMRPGNDDRIRALMRSQIRNAAGYVAGLDHLYEHPESSDLSEMETIDGRTIERFGDTLVSASGEQLGHIRFYRDITERRAAERKLQFANVLLETQMEASPAGIVVIDPNHQIIAFNRLLTEMWPVVAAEVAANQYDAGFAKVMTAVKDAEAFGARINHLFAHPNEVGDDEVETLDGRIFDSHSVSLHTDSGAYLGRAWFFSEITERRAAEQKLQFANLLLTTQMEAAPDGILVVDANRHLISCNARFAEIWRLSAADLQAGDDEAIRAEMSAQTAAPAAYSSRNDFLATHPAEIVNDEVEMADGRTLERYTRTLYSAAGGLAAGTLLGRVWFYRDITERRAAEQKLQFANLLLKTQMEASPDGILVVDPHKNIIAFSRRLAEIWQIPLTELENNEYHKGRAKIVSSIKDPAAFLARIDHLLAHPDEIGNDEIETLDGRTIERHSVSLRTEAGAYLGRAWFFSDVTAIRQAAAALAYRDSLLHAVTIATSIAVRAASLDAGVPDALGEIGEILKVDRIAVIQLMPGNTPPLGLRYLWESPYAAVPFDIAAAARFNAAEMAAWRAPLRNGTPVFADSRTAQGAVRDVLAYYQLKSICQIPVYVEGAVWGFISVDDGRTSRHWTASELETFAILADIAGALVVRERARVALETSEDMSRRLTTTAKDAVILTGPSGEVLQWNQAAEQIFGYTAAEALGRLSADLIVRPQDREQVNRGIVEASADLAVTVEFTFIRKDGSEVATEISVSAMPINGGFGILGILRDITDRKTAEKKLLFANTIMKTQMEASPDGILAVDSNRRIISYNQRVGEIWNVPAAVIANGAAGTLRAAIAATVKDPEFLRAAVDRLIAHPTETFLGEIETIDNRWIEVRSSALRTGDGTDLGIIWFYRDTTERRAAEAKLLFSNTMLKTQMEASPDGILAVDVNRRIISYNQRVAEIWNVPATLLTAGDANALRAAHLATLKHPAYLDAAVERLLAHPEETFLTEIETLDNRWIEIQSRSLGAPGGDYLGRIWFYRDITLRRAAEALALRHARFDDLTGLANRAVFIEAVQSAIAHANRGGPGFAVLFLDLDHFKDVNDTLGHPAGDALLREVAARLLANIRETDTAGRFGGDEFAIAATEIHDPADAALLAEKLLTALSEPYLIAGNTIHIETSIGVDIFSPQSAAPETLLSHADVALYRAKAEGRGMYRFFTPSMDRDVHSRVKLAAELREGIANGELFLLYQPQVAAATGRITGLEALVRWNHPTRGVLVPANFIAIAEATGLIGALGHFVLWEACRQAQAWITAGLPPTRVSINVSALQFKTALALEADIAAALQATGLPPHLLELELTETVLMGASRDHSDTLRRLRERGLKISIDDFGTGYSSLDYLRRFPVDRIKIAQSFVKNVESEPGDASIVRAIIGLARTLRIKLIVEGVATRSQLELLQGWGCSEVQGFYFARPLPPETIALHLQSGTITPP